MVGFHNILQGVGWLGFISYNILAHRILGYILPCRQALVGTGFGSTRITDEYRNYFMCRIHRVIQSKYILYLFSYIFKYKNLFSNCLCKKLKA